MSADLPEALLPLLGLREAWVVGLVVVLAVLRPVRRLGWAVAGALIAGGIGSVAVLARVGERTIQAGAWQALPWVALAALLAVAAAGRPLRWEPRSGPSATTALIAGAIVLHLGHAWHASGGALDAVAPRWGSPSALDASHLTPDTAGGPLTWPLAWAVQALPGVTARQAVAALGLAAVVAAVWGAGRVARRWGYTGTARTTAAAVAWAPPLLIAHADAVPALVATAALVWSWWALGEVWAGRHLPSRMALLSGSLLGLAIGAGPWAVIVLPLWIGRVGGRRAAWFSVGLGAAVLAGLLVLEPTAVTPADLWRSGVAGSVRAAGVPAAFAWAVAGLAVLTAALRVPLSPTRLSALSAALLAASTPLWSGAWNAMGPVAALPFVLLAAVAPDRPGERWPPDAPLPADEVTVGIRS